MVIKIVINAVYMNINEQKIKACTLIIVYFKVTSVIAVVV